MGMALINHLLQSYGYLAVFVFVALESVGVPLPGETALIAAALYAGSTHRLNVGLIALVAAVAAVAGDNGGYWLGQHGGTRLVRRYGHWVRLDARKLKVGRYLFARHGGKVVFFGRFIRAVRQSQRLDHLIAELLVLAKADAQHLAGRRQPVDLAALLADLRDTTPAPGISIDLSVPPGTATAGNQEDLSRMFRNLLDNAVRYARHRVLITVRITGADEPDRVVVEIADDGPGIPAEERERVFGRFVRLDASREQASGSAGLGLAIAREIAAAHGAAIVLTEAPDGGTRAIVTLGGTAGSAGETTVRSV